MDNVPELEPGRVESALRDLVARLAPGSARLEKQKDEVVMLRVIPGNPSSAPILVELEVEGGRAYLTIGEGVHVEIDADTTGDPRPLALLLAYCEAAIRGKVSEKTWARGGRTWLVKGSIQLADRVVRTSSSEAFGLGRFLPSRKATRRYAAYHQG